MRCEACGKDNDRQAHVCYSCGAGLLAPEGSQFCARCGDLQSGVRCTRCGAALRRIGGEKRLAAITVARDDGPVEIERHRVEPARPSPSAAPVLPAAIELPPATLRMPVSSSGGQAASHTQATTHATEQRTYVQLPTPLPAHTEPSQRAYAPPPVASALRPIAHPPLEGDDGEYEDEGEGPIERPSRLGVVARVVAAALVSTLIWYVLSALIEGSPEQTADAVRAVTPSGIDEVASARVLAIVLQTAIGLLCTAVVFRLTTRRRAR